MGRKLTVYHGSPFVIDEPIFGEGNPGNDFGPGFYCTERKGVAQQWACAEETDGYVNQYELDMGGLSVLDLSGQEYTILHWLAILLDNRKFVLEESALPGRQYLLDNYLPDYRNVDIIRGCRADEPYFSYASAFLNNQLTYKELGRIVAMEPQDEQVVLASPKALEHLIFEGADFVPVDSGYSQKIMRGAWMMKNRKMWLERSGLPTYMKDIVRRGKKTDGI